METGQLLTEEALPLLPKQISSGCEASGNKLVNGISDKVPDNPTIDAMPENTKTFTPKVLDNAEEESPRSPSPEPPPVSPLTSPAPPPPCSTLPAINLAAMIAAVTAGSGGVQISTSLTTPSSVPLTVASSTDLPVENKPETVQHGGLSLSLLQANEELLSDDPEASDEEAETEAMDTHSEYDYPLPSTASSQGSEIPDSLPDDSRVTPSSSSGYPPGDTHMRAQSSEMSANTSPSKPSSSSSRSTDSFVLDTQFSPLHVPEDAVPAPLDMSSRNFPKRSRHAHRAAVYAMHPYHRAASRGGTGVGVAKTLDLLKAVLQSSFNQEMKRLCDDYFKIFSLAAANINENTSESVPESTLRMLICKMMDDAQHGYQNGRWDFPSGQLPKNERVTASKGSPMSTKKPRTDRELSRYNTGSKRGRKPTEKVTDNARAAWKWGLDKRRLDPIKWSPEKLGLGTLFVLGVNVNKALGHAANRGKVYLLHPELFKFVCDGDDKTWLYENKFLPVHGGKAFLMIYSEVQQLVETEELYRDNPEIVRSVEKLQRFHVPQFMLNKMKDFIKNVQGYFAQENCTNGNRVPETSSSSSSSSSSNTAK